MGSIFSQKPYLCCKDCNSGWMQRFEDEMKKFATPLFATKDHVNIDDRQRRVMAVWICLITILAEHMNKNSDIAISEGDKIFIRKRLIPPDTWTIFVCSLNATGWRFRYKHHTTFLGEFRSRSEYDAAIMAGVAHNTQISSFGMGNIFVQTFCCPDLRQVQNFQAMTGRNGLVRLWPPPSRIWPFKRRATKFPTKLVIDEDQAEHLSNAFSERLKIMTRPPYFGGQSLPYS
jgi:hypothetical protein